MATPRQHLAHAPIEEALIDFRVRPAPGVALLQLDPLAESLANLYPNRQNLRSFSATIQFGPDAPLPQRLDSENGWLLRSSDGHSVVRITLEGFTFSRLRPYTTWEEVLAEAYRLWLLYAAIAHPLQVVRLATRFINKEQLPAGVDAASILIAPPVLAPPSPRQIRRFVTLVEVHDPARGASATVIQSMEPAPAGATILLDIDAYMAVPLAPEAPEIRPFLESLRQLKNAIFFASVTESAVEAWS